MKLAATLGTITRTEEERIWITTEIFLNPAKVKLISEEKVGNQGNTMETQDIVI